jgi:hypothetical protein
LVDHLVWAGANLEQEIDRLEALTGVRAMRGGRHPGEGTHNALIGLGPAMYLELIAPDPTHPELTRPRWLGLDTLTAPRLVTWAAKCADLERHAAAAQRAGVALGEVRSGERELGDGRVLSWRLTYPDMRFGGGVVPFLIDWGRSPHPAGTAPGGIRLVDLRAEHPDPSMILAALRVLGLELRVYKGVALALIAVLDAPRGVIELR